MFHATLDLGRATLSIGTTHIDIALFGSGQRGPAIGTGGGHDPDSFATVSSLHDRPQYFGNHITGFSNDDRIAKQDTLGLHDVLIVQSGTFYFTSRDSDGLQHRIGGGATGAPHTDHNVEKFGGHLLRRIFIRNRPPRSTRGLP